MSKYGNYSPLLMQQPARREQRQFICCSHPLSRGNETPKSLRHPLPCGEDVLPAPCATMPGAGSPKGSALSTGTATQARHAVGPLIYHPLSWCTALPCREGVRHIERCSSTGVLPGDSCPRADIRSKLQVSGFWSSGGLNDPCWQCHALFDSVFQSLLSLKSKSWILAVAWCFHLLQPNGRCGLDASAAQCE